MKLCTHGIFHHRRSRIASRFAGAAIASLVMVCGVTHGEQPSQHADETPAAKTDPVKTLILEKLQSIIIPKINFETITVEEGIEFLRWRAAELDSEKDFSKKGLSIVIRKAPQAAPAAGPPPTSLLGEIGDDLITLGAFDGRLMIHELRVRNVALGTALKYICNATNLCLSIDETGVVISPKTEAAAELVVPVNAIKKAAILKKLDSIIIPKIDFESATVEEMIDYLRLRSAELDSEPDPSKKGINYVICIPGAPRTLTIRELKLKNVSVAVLLKSICDLTKLRYTVDDTAVIISPEETAGAKAATPKAEP